VQLVDLAEKVVTARSLEELDEHVLHGVAEAMGSPSVLVYVADPRLPARQLMQQGFQTEAASEIERLCAEQYEHICSQPGWQRFTVSDVAGDLMLHPLRAKDECVGLIGVTADEGAARISPDVLERLPRLLANAIARLVEHIESQKRLSHLNTYLTVSSM
jgi:hypothetical protein